jgi:hypothetical protein
MVCTVSTKNLPEFNAEAVKISFSFWRVYEMLVISDEAAAVVVKDQILCRLEQGFYLGRQYDER